MTVLRRSTRRHHRRSRRPALRLRLAWAGTRMRIGLLMLIGLCLLLALRCLELIGPPPAVRIDALWVSKNVYLVRVMIVALTVAAAATCTLALSRRGRLIAVVLWVLAAVAAIWLYDDRLWIILRVMTRHA